LFAKLQLVAVLYQLIPLIYLVCLSLKLKKEQFIAALAKETYNHSKKNAELEYRHLAQLVEKNEKFEFLQGLALNLI